MSEVTTPRLMAAAKEFNIGKDTLVDFLVSKGFSKDELKPTSKLTEQMYRSLQQEFQSDKVAKLKSDQIDLPKGGSTVDLRKKKEDADSSKKEDRPALAEEETPSADTAIPGTTLFEDKAPAAAETKADAEAEKEVIKIDAPEITGPKIVKKIDLSEIDSSTRPKKSSKKKSEDKAEPVSVPKDAPVDEPKPEDAPVNEPVEKPAVTGDDAEETTEQTTAATPATGSDDSETADDTPQIENIRAQRLEGPKIMGKIDLPVDNDTRPKPAAKDEKRKRKRIPIEKKGEGQTGGGASRPGAGTAGTGQPRQNANLSGRIQKQGDRPKGAQQGGDRRGQGQYAAKRKDEREIDQKEIQEKIKQTQAKLSGGGRPGKGAKARYRREKREHQAEQMGGMVGDDNKLQVTEFISVSELASLMDVSFADVIAKCMGLGIMVSINQRLDAEVIELVASEFGYEVEFIGMDEQAEFEEEEEVDAEEDLQPRAPIVTIMGHVDHGKTSLLDYIRNTKVIAGEAGGITQHIGAYEVELPNGKRIAFLDTPGHEAFTAMRARGAKVTDIAVIVIAADDAVMPQTKEAISHAQAAGVPMIFAINKIDREGANPQKIYEQLANLNILVEEWGGKYQSQEISAKQGLNIELLLEKILLEAELLDLK
ncbi:MAG TPA: translation initiation factor IF-2 N-terminal domain-containing protein, partial [Parasegetibacter sp.]